MPRIARADIANYPYHIINRAVMRLRIFSKEDDYVVFEKIIQDAVSETEMRIIAYSIMPNHWHFLLYPKENGALGLFMHRLTNTHTRQIKAQTKTNGTGPLYQGRYKSFMIQNDSHFLAVLKYIERNPVRADLVKKAEDWRWGSAWRRIHGSTQQKKILAESPVALPSKYQTWVNTPESPRELDQIRNSVARSAPYGNESWVEKTVKQFNLSSTLRDPWRPKKCQ
jgi:putative transposase